MSQYNKISQGRLLQNPEPQMPTRYVDDNQYEMLMDAMNNPKEFGGHGVGWWITLVVGAGLIVFPEPATTATGLLIVSGLLGAGALSKSK